MSRSHTPSTLWTKNLDREEDVEAFLESLRLSKMVQERLKEILEQRSTEIINSAISNTTFEYAAWSNKQASMMGELRTLKFIIKLLGV